MRMEKLLPINNCVNGKFLKFAIDNKIFRSLMKYSCSAFMSALLLSSCSGLSPEAREIVGVYYNNELSDDTPVLELNDDGTSVMRAIKPDVLTIEVPGTWNVVNDSLVIDNDVTKIVTEGDTSVLGDVATKYSRLITRHDELSLTLAKDGIEYLYHRKVTPDKD